MGVWDVITDLVEAATPWSTADAEAPQAPAEEKETTESEDTKTEKASGEEESEEPAEEAEEEPEEEEEEEEELEDPKEKFEEEVLIPPLHDAPKYGSEAMHQGKLEHPLTTGTECKNSKQCAPAKHHFDECVERVTKASDDNGEQEDCVEEFFHLAHCATQCAAPKLWSVLK
ncbi:ubiquinol-cytochrome C reductase hinge protein-domain-containing protein [Xylaria longipes]|nr:ubiquinol-cytochrome C reductase hinge protein-domain-containing protein [Xylaria longipes]